MREAPSLQARIVARPAAGAVQSNLGGQPAEGRTGCDVQPLHGGPRGYLPSGSLAPATAPYGTVPTGEDDSALRAGQGRFDASGSVACAQYAGQPLGAHTSQADCTPAFSAESVRVFLLTPLGFGMQLAWIQS